MSNQDSLREIVGLIIWWTEGTKSRKDKRWINAWTYNVEVTNTNPDMIKIFLSFLRNDIGINENKLKLQLQVHYGDDVAALEKYWSDITSIPIKNFSKTIIRPAGNKIGKTNGTCKIRYCDKSTYKQLKVRLDNIVTSIIGV